MLNVTLVVTWKHSNLIQQTVLQVTVIHSCVQPSLFYMVEEM